MERGLESERGTHSAEWVARAGLRNFYERPRIKMFLAKSSRAHYHMDIITKAKEFATKAHGSQMRYGGKAYIVHPEEVAELTEASGGSEVEIAAAWLHDTVEDTLVSIEDIQKEFGKEIAEVVIGLTDLPEWESLSMVERKAKQAERVKDESIFVKRVKLADQISNVRLCAQVGIAEFFTDAKAYAHSAKKIADECQGISELLDSCFEEAYQKAIQIHGA